MGSPNHHLRELSSRPTCPALARERQPIASRHSCIQQRLAVLSLATPPLKGLPVHAKPLLFSIPHLTSSSAGHHRAVSTRGIAAFRLRPNWPVTPPLGVIMFFQLPRRLSGPSLALGSNETEWSCL